MTIVHDSLDYEYKSEIVCPYCLHKREADSEDHGGQDADIKGECYKCGKHFIYTTDYDVTFSSRLVPCLNGHPHQWRVSYDHPPHKIQRCNFCGTEQRFLDGVEVKR